MVIVEEVTLDPTPTRGAEIDKAGGRQGPGQISPRERRNTCTPQTPPHHTIPRLPSLLVSGHPHEQIITCSVMCFCGWVRSQRKSKNGTLYIFQERAVCPKSFDIPSVGCVANAGLAGLSVSQGLFVTPDIGPSCQPACALGGCFLAMIIMTMGPEVLCQNARTTTCLASTRRPIHDESRPTPPPHDRTDPLPPLTRLATGRDQAGWRQSQPWRE